MPRQALRRSSSPVPLIASGLALVAAASLAACRSDGPGPAMLQASVDSLGHSEFVVGPGAGLDPARNTIWSGSIKLAWDALGDAMGGPLSSSGADPAAEILATTAFDDGDVDPASVVVRAGPATPALVRSVGRALRERGSPADPAFEQAVADAPEGALFAYAEIYKNLGFETRFDDLASAPLPFQGVAEQEPTLVDAFGIGYFSWQNANHKKLHDIVQFHETEDRSEYCVVLEPKDALDRIVLARVAPAATLGGTWDRAQALISSAEAMPLSEGDRFVAPEVDFDLEHRFVALEGLMVRSSTGAEAPLQNVQQRLRLKLDEAGMVMRSRTFMGAASAAVSNKPRELVFDRPFLLAAFEEGSQSPYLLAWIAHPELLTPVAP